MFAIGLAATSVQWLEWAHCCPAAHGSTGPKPEWQLWWICGQKPAIGRELPIQANLFAARTVRLPATEAQATVHIFVGSHRRLLYFCNSIKLFAK